MVKVFGWKSLIAHQKEMGKIFLNIRFLWLGVKIILMRCRRLSFEWIDQVRGI
jgi:hypothetical protein